MSDEMFFMEHGYKPRTSTAEHVFSTSDFFLCQLRQMITLADTIKDEKAEDRV